MNSALQNFFKENGLLHQFQDNYEFREQQLDMALAIEGAIKNEDNIMIEAGTGIGKSLAYLAPFAIWATESDSRVIVATNTKTLQEQLINKDLPLLKKALNIDLKYSLALGTENYLCVRRLRRAFQQELFDTRNESMQFEKILQWSENTNSGLILDLDFQPHDSVWAKVRRESDLCRGKKCPNRDNCFYMQARKKWSTSHIIIANHHLFFTNIAAESEALPTYNAIVFDEAHNIEDVAVNYLGCKFSNRQLDYLLNQLHKPKGSSGLIEKLFADDTQTQLLQLVKAVRQANAVFSEEILSNTGTESTVRMRENISLTDHLSDPITDLCDSLKENLILIKEEDDKTEIEGMVRRLDAIKNSLSLIINRKLKDSVYWIETNQFNKNTHIALNASPIDIAPILKEKVFDITRPSVLVSATLAVGKSFNFHRERLGLDDAKELMLSSPFDYEKQVGLYVSDKLPHPQNKKVDFENGLTKKIHHIIDVMQGRTLVLFTSYKMMENVFENLINTVNGVTLLKQGDLPRWQLLEALKETDDTILLGTNSFWQGIDLPGKSLECVVITKLPFAVPNHPLTEARLEDIERRGKNPFMDYQVPQAVLMLKQGFGRLIRHRNDKGLIIILDPRIKTQRYGKIFLDSLPKCRMIEQLDHIEDVFTSLNN